MKYVRTSPPIEAIQWTGKNQEEVRAFVGKTADGDDCALFPQSHAEHDPQLIEVFTTGGHFYATAGCWILKLGKGVFISCLPDVFARLYVPAPDAWQVTPTPESAMLFSADRVDPSTVKAQFLKKAARNRHTEHWHRALEALPGDGTLEQLKEIGIPQGWYSKQCSCCSGFFPSVVSFDVNGGEYDYALCEACLVGALMALRRPPE